MERFFSPILYKCKKCGKGFAHFARYVLHVGNGDCL